MSDSLLDHSAHTQNAGGKRDSPLVTVLKVVVALGVVAMLGVLLWVSFDTNSKLYDTSRQLSAMNARTRDGELSAFGCQHMPPRKYQLARGTCWDFGTIGALEHQYRLQGIAQGWLQPAQYVQFSEQAYGNQIIALCQQNQHLCLLPGDNVAFNSTEGGEATLLQTFASQLRNRILPHSVCPYLTVDNSSCPGIAQRLANNPISFGIDQQTTLYDITHIKAALRQFAHAMPLTVTVHTTAAYAACNDPFFAHTPQCTDPAQCVACPTDGNFPTACCYQFETDMFKMNGEFYKHHALQLEAGHVMLLAGYNDDWTTESGMTGGLIVRNSWIDGVYSFSEFGAPRQRGSHSLAYFLGQISLGDERMVCPNSADPRSWYTCGGGSIDPVAITQNCVGHDATGVNENLISAQALYQPYTLSCRAKAPAGTCTVSPTIFYYALNSTIYGDELALNCYLEYDSVSKVGTPKCFSPRPLDSYSLLFGPVAAEDYQNKDDVCGYYILPYEMLRESEGIYHGFFVNDYHVTFTTGSFQANAAANAALDYSWIQASTGTQTDVPAFDTAYPNDQTQQQSRQ